MAKLSISRILEVSKYLTTEAGRDLKDVLEYLSQFSEQTIRALRNGLTFQDNFNAAVVNVSIPHDTDQPLQRDTSNRRPLGIVILKSNSKVDSFNWFIDDQDRPVLNVSFLGSPELSQDMTILILY